LLLSVIKNIEAAIQEFKYSIFVYTAYDLLLDVTLTLSILNNSACDSNRPLSSVSHI